MSPIAEALRNSLATETWAHPGLGLPVREKVVEAVVPGPPQLTSTPAPSKTGGVYYVSDSYDKFEYFRI